MRTRMSCGLAAESAPQDRFPRSIAPGRTLPLLMCAPRARPEVLDHDVRAAREAAHDLLAFRPAQVAGNGLLVARLHVPPQRGAVAHPPPLAQRIAFAGRLELDHLGAEVAERLGAERTGDQRAELYNANAGKRARHRKILRTKYEIICAEIICAEIICA